MATRLAVGVAAALLAAAAAAPSVDLPTFLAAGDLAQLFPSMPTATLTLPTELHILFIGFSGESLPAVNTTDEELTPWFQQLRAILPHTILPHSILPHSILRATTARTPHCDHGLQLECCSYIGMS